MTLVTEAGLVEGPTIDGTVTVLAREIDIRDTLRQSLDQTFNGGYNLDVPYDGDGLPDQPDTFEAALDYDLSDAYASTLSFLEGLRTAGGAHLVVFWKKRRYRFTARSGQTVFYLPRADAYSKSYSGHTAAADKAAIIVTPTPGAGQPTVVYQTSVVSGDVVTAGQVWISNTAVPHPRSGRNVALFKFGTAPGAAATIDVEYYPLFRMFVQGVPTKPFSMIGREDRTLYLIESAT